MSEKLMRNINPFGLRMQPHLREKVEAAAKTSRRSVNAELIARLEETFAIESTLQELFPGAALYETSALLLDINRERDEALEALHQMSIEVHAQELNGQLEHNTAMLEKIEARIELLIEQTKPKT